MKQHLPTNPHYYLLAAAGLLALILFTFGIEWFTLMTTLVAMEIRNEKLNKKVIQNLEKSHQNVVQNQQQLNKKLGDLEGEVKKR